MEYCYIHPKDDEYEDWGSDELKHYGVKGMHWGIRRYQPYTSSNKRKDGRTGKFVGQKKDKKGLMIPIPATPTTAAISAGAMAVMLAAGATRSGVNKHRATKAKAHIDANKNVEVKTGLKKIDQPESVKDSMKKINTEHNSFLSQQKGRTNNCTSCAMALTLRQKGYDVRAKSMDSGLSNEKDMLKKAFGVKNTNVDKTYDGSNFELSKKGEMYIDLRKLTPEQSASRYSAMNGTNYKHTKAVESWAKTQPNQSGQLMLRWGQGGGHATNYEIIDGKMVIHDPQSNKTLKGGAMREWLNQSWTSDFYRLDDKKIKDSKVVKNMVYH